MPRFRVLLTDRAWPDCELERKILAEVGADLCEPAGTDEATLIEAVRDVDAIGACWAQVTPAVLAAAPRCRVIARFGIGLDNIPVAAATARQIPVTYVPDYCVEEVADHAIALLLACARNIGFFHQRTKSGEYRLAAGPPLRRLAGRMLGLLGFGRVARAVAVKARCLGLEVIAHSLSGDDHGTGVRMVTLEELIAESDFLSLHAPLTAETRGIIGPAEFARMRPTAFLINTARGPLVNTGALQAALEPGLIAGAAPDIYAPEPSDLSPPLYRNERVIVTPHAAFLSVESLLELRTRATRQIAVALTGGRPEHVVNPSVYSG